MSDPWVSLTARREQKKINAYQITPHEFVQAAAANKYALAPAGAKVQNPTHYSPASCCGADFLVPHQCKRASKKHSHLIRWT